MSERSLIKGSTQLVGVIGNPITHSLSPTIHNHWINKYQLDAVYLPIQLTEVNIHSFLKSVVKSNFRGFNITVPFKQIVFEIIDNNDKLSGILKAANTISVDDSLNSYNTDVAGFMEPLIAHTEKLKNKRAVVIGAGGAARAVCVGLKNLGISNFTIINRTVERAETLLKELHLQGSAVSECSIFPKDVAIVVNTTSLGMKNMPDLQFDLTPFGQDTIVYDIVYNPAETSLLKQANKQGLKTINGLPMLVGQAQHSFKIWFNIFPAYDEDLASLLNKAL